MAGRSCRQGDARPGGLKGYWFDRTKEYAARHRREEFDRLKYATPETLTLDPLPCWKDLTDEERYRRVAALVAEIEMKAATRREATGKPSVGANAVPAHWATNIVTEKITIVKITLRTLDAEALNTVM
jgi:hypothetical protein